MHALITHLGTTTRRINLHKGMGRFHLGTAALAALFLALAGCSASEATPIGSEDSGFPKNQKTWALPLDAFQTDWHNLEMRATQLVEGRCMEGAGFDNYPYFDYDLDAPPSPSLSPGGVRIFNETLASQWGYRMAPSRQSNPAKNRAAIKKFNAEATPEALKQWDSCIESAKTVVSAGYDVGGMALAAGLGSQDDPLAAASVKAGIKAWRDCMRPMGLADLPNTPMEMPGVYVAGMSGDGSGTSLDPDSLAYVEDVPVREKEIAVADARCQESSGYAAALYDAEYQADLAAYHQHEADLQRIKKQRDEYQKHLRSIISKYASGA